MIRWVIFLLIFGIIDFYAYQAFKTVNKNSYLNIAYWLITLLVIGNFLYRFYGLNRSDYGNSHAYAFAFLVAIMVPKMIMLVLMFAEDIFRLPQALYSYFFENDNTRTSHMPSRRKFISQIALGLAAIPLVSILYGIYKGKYNFKVLKYTLHFEDLPSAFDGFKLTQISDIHSGSFDNPAKVEYAIDLINEQESDTIMFTGDMVNNETREMLPYKKMFSKLSARDGIFSVLGNHDYGDYIRWPSEEAKKQNLEDLKSLQKDMGFDLLLNESRFIERKGERIAIVGV